MPRISSTTSLLALLAALALAGPVAADEGHDHDAETAEAHEEAHGHDDDHGHGDDDHADEGDDAHAFEAAGVKVVHPWMNATSGREALIFFELENTGAESVSLSGAEAPFAEEAMLVGFALEGGEGTYEALPFVPVQPGRSLELAPEGLAILASGLTRSFEEGTTASITLLTSAGEIALTVAVESKNARQHSHAGHNH